jgi:putative glutamine amidotransferase
MQHLRRNPGVVVHSHFFYPSLNTEHRPLFLRLPLSLTNATIWCSMSPADTQLTNAPRPRVGIPWRTTQEQRDGIRDKLDLYFQAVRKAGADPVDVSLQQSPAELEKQLQDLDAFVLPGSPADVDPARYGEPRHAKTVNLDPNRDNTDAAILRHALSSSKPVLAICYGCQILNVHLNGTLVQDIHGEKPASGPHGTTDLPPGSVKGDIEHQAQFAPESRLANLNGSQAVIINSSHHQAIDKPGENLRVAAHAPDGTIEAIEWTGSPNWVVGVQWHPERRGDALSEKLFAEFVGAARSAREAVAHKM